jgi:hypothetical protein
MSDVDFSHLPGPPAGSCTRFVKAEASFLVEEEEEEEGQMVLLLLTSNI